MSGARSKSLNARCNKPFPMTYLKNRIKMITKLLLQQYYCGMYKCSDNTCDVETR